MSNTINSTDFLNQYSVKDQEKKDTKELGQDVFLELMITQMRNQDPLDPQKNSEFVAQLAQFSSVEGIDKLNTGLEGIAKTMNSYGASLQSSQALQASSMVGRTVKVETDTAYLTDDKDINGTVYLSSDATDVAMNIYNDKGVRVSDVSLGEQTAGEIAFSFNGKDAEGNRLPAGKYRFEVLAKNGYRSIQMPIALSANVDSVTIGKNGTYSLNVAGYGSVSINDVKEIL